MKREIITAESVLELLKGNPQQIFLSPHGIITPAAQDILNSRHVSVTRQKEEQAQSPLLPPSCSGNAASACTVSGCVSADSTSLNNSASGNAALGCAVSGCVSADSTTSNSASSGCSPDCASAGSSSDQRREFEKIREEVLAKLPPELRRPELVDQIIHKMMEPEGKGAGLNPAPESFRSAQQEHEESGESKKSGKSGKSGDSRNSGNSEASDSCRSRAGGVIRIDSGRLPWKKFVTDTVNIVDVVGSEDNSPMGAGYLEWDNSRFDWTLDYAEIDTVLEGELHITAAGKTVQAKKGDVVYIPKGTSLTFSSPGYVRFSYVTFPADWGSE